jgi:hypothetical protein
MSAHDLPQYRDAALVAGARWFIDKSELVSKLPLAIRDLWPPLETSGGPADA